MGVNWAAGFFHWKPHVRKDGSERPLSHLHPFRFQLAYDAGEGQPAREVTINVGFSCHVFTRKVEDAGPDPEFYSDNREIRVFDEERYEWSHSLRTIVIGLERRKCFFASGRNFVIYEVNGTPAGYEYQVFFSVRRLDSRSIELIVESAYLATTKKTPAGLKKKQIRFRVIVSKVLLKQPLIEAR
jgi:hypothetical protein